MLWMFSCYISLCSDFLITGNKTDVRQLLFSLFTQSLKIYFSENKKNAYVFGEFANHMTQLLLTITELPHTRQTFQKLKVWWNNFQVKLIMTSRSSLSYLSANTQQINNSADAFQQQEVYLFSDISIRKVWFSELEHYFEYDSEHVHTHI